MSHATCLSPIGQQLGGGTGNYYEQMYSTGPMNNCITSYIDHNGNGDFWGGLYTQGISSFPSDIVQGVSGSGTLLSNTVGNSSLSVPILISSGVSQGQSIVVSGFTTGNPSYVSGLPAATSNLTTVIGVADASASSGTVVNVDYSGLAVALATGAVSVGDLLVSSTNAVSPNGGLVGTNNSASVGSIIGTALTTNTAAASPQLIRVLLHH